MQPQQSNENGNQASRAARRPPVTGLAAIVIVFVLGGFLLARMGGSGGGTASTPQYMPVTTDIGSVSFDAGKAGTPVVAVVTADWCPPCQELKRTTLTNQRVRALLVNNAQPVMIDGTDTAKASDTLQRLGVRVFPSTVVLRDGKPVAMLEGFANPDKYLAWLESHL